MHHGHGQRQALAHAQRHGIRQFVQHLLQTEALDHFLDATVDFRFRDVEQLGMQYQVLPYAQLVVQ